MAVAGGGARIDLPMGNVPDYRTFVRRVWEHRCEGVSPVSAPPYVFSVEFDFDFGPAPVFSTALELVSMLRAHHGVGERIEVRHSESGDRVHDELLFRDLEALHLFCCALARCGCQLKDPQVVDLGEYIMWTVGFRWV